MYICAWCEKRIRRSPGNLYGEPAVKHGLCARCLKTELAKLETLPPAIEPLPARLPAPDPQPLAAPAVAAA